MNAFIFGGCFFFIIIMVMGEIKAYPLVVVVDDAYNVIHLVYSTWLLINGILYCKSLKSFWLLLNKKNKMKIILLNGIFNIIRGCIIDIWSIILWYFVIK